jgi:hypothetical protein
MPKLFDDENIGVFMNIDERRHFCPHCACPRENASVTTTWKRKREVSLFTCQNSTYTHKITTFDIDLV